MRLLKIIIGTIVLFFVCAAISITLSIPLVVFAISGSILAIYINCKITLKEQRIRREQFYLQYKSRKPYPAWGKETEGFRSARAICIGLYIRDCIANRIGLPSALIYPQDIISHIVNDFGEFRGNLYVALNDINRIVGYGELCYLKTFVEVANYIDITFTDDQLRKKKIFIKKSH